MLSASRPSIATAFLRCSSPGPRATSHAASASTSASNQEASNQDTTEANMSPQELQVQQKRELEKKQESTVPARFFVPTTDIFETDQALSLIVEMPGVDRSKVDVSVEDGVLTIEG